MTIDQQVRWIRELDRRYVVAMRLQSPALVNLYELDKRQLEIAMRFTPEHPARFPSGCRDRSAA